MGTELTIKGKAVVFLTKDSFVELSELLRSLVHKAGGDPAAREAYARFVQSVQNDNSIW